MLVNFIAKECNATYGLPRISFRPSQTRRSVDSPDVAGQTPLSRLSLGSGQAGLAPLPGHSDLAQTALLPRRAERPRRSGHTASALDALWSLWAPQTGGTLWPWPPLK